VCCFEKAEPLRYRSTAKKKHIKWQQRNSADFCYWKVWIKKIQLVFGFGIRLARLIVGERVIVRVRLEIFLSIFCWLIWLQVNLFQNFTDRKHLKRTCFLHAQIKLNKSYYSESCLHWTPRDRTFSFNLNSVQFNKNTIL
jgi:hypothetical protein